TLLEFSRIEAGVVAIDPRVFRLQSLLGQLGVELGPVAERGGLAYCTRPTHLATRADPAIVERILRNLVGNAIRYTEKGGLLVACRRRAGRISVEVWDTGIGIPSSELEAIFSDFHQLGNPERDRRKGLGLGLSIADSLARQIGERVTVASRLGR